MRERVRKNVLFQKPRVQCSSCVFLHVRECETESSWEVDESGQLQTAGGCEACRGLPCLLPPGGE